ncbi:MAG: hypothetical protein CMH81_06605 [Nitrospiraceae bacterium]|nr:hypothetical protein [Nitrospiraceae bacterium]
MKRYVVVGLGIVGMVLAVTGLALNDLALLPTWGVTGIAALALGCLITFFILHFETVKTFSAQRSTRLGFNSILMVLLFLGILEVINFLNARHPLRIDLSESKEFTVAHQTRGVLESLVEPMTITAFSKEGSKGATRYRSILDTYRYHTDYITYTVADPDKKPALARKYGITKFDTAILESGDRTTEVIAPTEQALTNGIIRVSRTDKTSVRFLVGHGEPGLDDTGKQGYSMLKASIENTGYDVSTISSLQDDLFSDRDSVLVIAGPRRMFTDDELVQVQKYILKKRRLLLLLDPVLQPETNTGLEPLLAVRGVSLGNGVIMDPESRLSGAEATIPIVTSYPEHEITHQFDLATFFPLARPLLFDTAGDASAQSDWDIDPLANTNATSWEEHDLQSADDATFDAATDIKGPLTVAVAVAPKKIFGHGGVELKNTDRSPTMVVIGDSDFVTNASVNFSGNRDFFLHALHWLAERGNLISISPTVASFTPMVLTRNQLQIVLYVQVLLLPGVVFGLGAYVWQRRRRL